MADVNDPTQNVTIWNNGKTKNVTTTTNGAREELDVSAVIDTDNAGGDAFGRSRVSEPETLFDSKLTHNKEPLLWDEELETGSGITSTHSTAKANVILASTLNTAGKFTRQTFQRFNYQPGKSQQIIMTGNLDISGGGTGVQRRIGYFDDDNGLFFEDDEGTIKVVQRSSVSGSPVDTKVAQSSWNIDTMDGTGTSGVTIDWTKSQIFVIDFQWLGVGRVRFGLEVDGVLYIVHEFLNTNAIEGVYMSTPNLPLRYQMVTTASSPASSMSAICSTVISEGGADDKGVLFYDSNAITGIDGNTAGTIYALMGMRLKSTHLDATIKIVTVSIMATTSTDYEWLLLFNPTVANAITFNGYTDSSVESGPGNAGNPSNSTLTGGTVFAGGYVRSSGSQGGVASGSLNNAILLGADISGNRDELYLAVRPLGNNGDFYGGIEWREVN
jgi:hypothetical protein